MLLAWAPMVLLLLACSEPPRDSQSAWAKYQSAVSQYAGSWRLGPLSQPIPGAPACIETLTIDFDVPAAPPAAFTLDDVPGTATISFCGKPEIYQIDSVVVLNQVAMQKAGSSGPSPLGPEAFEFRCSSTADAARYLSMRFDPGPLFGEGTEHVGVSFAQPEWRHPGNDPEVSVGMVPVLGFVRP